MKWITYISLFFCGYIAKWLITWIKGKQARKHKNQGRYIRDQLLYYATKYKEHQAKQTK